MRQFNCRINNRSLNRRPRLTEVQVGCPLNPADLPEPGLASGLDARSRWPGNRTGASFSRGERCIWDEKEDISDYRSDSRAMVQVRYAIKSLQAYRRIRKLIENGHLEAGEQVTETKARLIGMSRGPVRESLLCLDGSILSPYHRGASQHLLEDRCRSRRRPITSNAKRIRATSKWEISAESTGGIREKIMNPRQRVISASIATGTTVPSNTRERLRSTRHS